MTRYVSTLPESVRIDIAWALVLAGIGGDDLSRAMESRLCDLEDTIDIRRWL